MRGVQCLASRAGDGTLMARLLGLSIWLLITLVACASPPSSAPASPGSTAIKRITMAMSGEPPSISSKLSPPGVAGVAAFERLVNVGLSVTDETGTYRPRLAETLPSVENGLWQVLPDGTMDTTWRI